MDLAKSLVRIVARAFYETKHILVVDALMIHSALRDDDLAHLLGMQTKELHKLCGKLKEDRLLAVHSRPEAREGTQRPINRTYYFVDFRETIDAIKYRAHKITKEVESSLRTTEEKKDFVCPRCKSRYALMDVLDNPADDGFNCHRCGHLLDREDENVGDSSGQKTLSRLFDQLNSIIKLLQQIDEVYIPEYGSLATINPGKRLTFIILSNDFESAFSNAVPVSRNQITNPAGPLAITPVAPAAVRGDANTATQLEVQLTSASEKSAAELLAEQARKAAVAAQNQLPVWHTNSTVTGEETALGRREAVAAQERQAANGFLGLKKEEEKKAVGNGKEEDALAQYYAELAREKEKEEREEREDDETSGEEYEDDFEDVGGIGTGSAGIGTPAAVPTSISAKLINGTAMARLQSQDSESGSSPATEANTPAFTQGTADEDVSSSGPVAKRPRFEEPKPQLEEDSEEEEEFEDVNTY